ncbi:MAG: hypothetical protein U1F43_29555 [Myxococcota bacterium]
MLSPYEDPEAARHLALKPLTEASYRVDTPKLRKQIETLEAGLGDAARKVFRKDQAFAERRQVAVAFFNQLRDQARDALVIELWQRVMRALQAQVQQRLEVFRVIARQGMALTAHLRAEAERCRELGLEVPDTGLVGGSAAGGPGAAADATSEFHLGSEVFHDERRGVRSWDAVWASVYAPGFHIATADVLAIVNTHLQASSTEDARKAGGIDQVLGRIARDIDNLGRARVERLLSVDRPLGLADGLVLEARLAALGHRAVDEDRLRAVPAAEVVEYLREKLQRVAGMSRPLGRFDEPVLAGKEFSPYRPRFAGVAPEHLRAEPMLGDALAMAAPGFERLEDWSSPDALSFYQACLGVPLYAWLEVQGPLARAYDHQSADPTRHEPLHIDHRWEAEGFHDAPGPGLPGLDPVRRRQWEAAQSERRDQALGAFAAAFAAGVVERAGDRWQWVFRQKTLATSAACSARRSAPGAASPRRCAGRSPRPRRGAGGRRRALARGRQGRRRLALRRRGRRARQRGARARTARGRARGRGEARRMTLPLQVVIADPALRPTVEAVLARRAGRADGAVVALVWDDHAGPAEAAAKVARQAKALLEATGARGEGGFARLVVGDVAMTDGPSPTVVLRVVAGAASSGSMGAMQVPEAIGPRLLGARERLEAVAHLVGLVVDVAVVERAREALATLSEAVGEGALAMAGAARFEAAALRDALAARLVRAVATKVDEAYRAGRAAPVEAAPAFPDGVTVDAKVAEPLAARIAEDGPELVRRLAADALEAAQAHATRLRREVDQALSTSGFRAIEPMRARVDEVLRDVEARLARLPTAPIAPLTAPSRAALEAAERAMAEVAPPVRGAWPLEAAGGARRRHRGGGRGRAIPARACRRAGRRCDRRGRRGAGPVGSDGGARARPRRSAAARAARADPRRGGVRGRLARRGARLDGAGRDPRHAARAGAAGGRARRGSGAARAWPRRSTRWSHAACCLRPRPDRRAGSTSRSTSGRRAMSWPSRPSRCIGASRPSSARARS